MGIATFGMKIDMSYVQKSRHEARKCIAGYP
jgi:hypothetical protein